jgi:Rod binding domain-containing protein
MLPDLRAGAKLTPSGPSPDKVRETARELEGVFLGMLLKSMRATVGNGGLFKEGTDSQTYRDMFDQEIGRSLSRAGGIGLAQLILRDQALREAAAGTKMQVGQDSPTLQNHILGVGPSQRNRPISPERQEILKSHRGMADKADGGSAPTRNGGTDENTE